MKLHLVDTDPVVVGSWSSEFAPFPEVEVVCSDILTVATNAVEKTARC